MSTHRAEKISISLPAPLARAVRKHVGSRGLSSFVARALEHELRRRQLGAFLDDLDAQLGPVPDQVLREARAVWGES